MQEVWHKQAFDVYSAWKKTNPEMVARVDAILDDIHAHPFVGKGKPEPLKWNLRGYWSRRITDAYRLIYAVKGNLLSVHLISDHYK